MEPPTSHAGAPSLREPLARPPAGPPMSHEPHNGASSRTHEVPDALRRALLLATERRDYESEELHAVVCEYVRELREAGFAPESVVIAVKHAVREATFGIAPYRLERRQSSDLLRHVLRWGIEEYYGGEPPGGAPV